MQTQAQKNLYCTLEQITEPISDFNSNRFKNWLAQIGHFIVKYLTTQDEPKIWQSKDWFGRSWWNVYLPRTGQTVRLTSEAEVRIWLEENLRF
jgi:hypothetical protein